VVLKHTPLPDILAANPARTEALPDAVLANVLARLNIPADRVIAGM